MVPPHRSVLLYLLAFAAASAFHYQSFVVWLLALWSYFVLVVVRAIGTCLARLHEDHGAPPREGQCCECERTLVGGYLLGFAAITLRDGWDRGTVFWFAFLLGMLMGAQWTVTNCLSWPREDGGQLVEVRSENVRLTREASDGTGSGHRKRAGVTNQARAEWTRYVWGDVASGEMVSSEPGEEHTVSMGVGVIEDNSVSKMETGAPLASTVDTEQTSCSICLGGYELGEIVVALPCDHLYHEPCIGAWTENSIRCPLCNYNLMGRVDRRGLYGTMPEGPGP